MAVASVDITGGLGTDAGSLRTCGKSSRQKNTPPSKPELAPGTADLHRVPWFAARRRERVGKPDVDQLKVYGLMFFAGRRRESCYLSPDEDIRRWFIQIAPPARSKRDP